MTLFWRNVTRGRANTTPTFDQGAKPSFWLALVKTAAALLIPAGLAIWYGQPALKIQYTYSGSYTSPTYHTCLYRSLLRWHDIQPLDGACPLVIYLPLNPKQ